MLFPFRSTAIFRNRWIALLWAAGICFMASEIVDSLSGVTDKAAHHAAARPAPSPIESDEARVAAVLQAPPPEPDRIVR